jgi:hypothetical protein
MRLSIGIAALASSLVVSTSVRALDTGHCAVDLSKPFTVAAADTSLVDKKSAPPTIAEPKIPDLAPPAPLGPAVPLLVPAPSSFVRAESCGNGAEDGIAATGAGPGD